MENSSLPLNDFHVKKTNLLLNRLHMFLHGIALLSLFYYRITTLIHNDNIPILPYILVFITELILSFIWLLSQASKWKPITRKVYIERLPENEKLPSIDVFICTADPNKEPSLGVMNTIISALALDYPSDNKLNVYLSDDGGSFVTLLAVKEAWKFAKFWIPFCRKYEVMNRCPDAYFLNEDIDDIGKFDRSHEFVLEMKEIEKKYEEFKDCLVKIIAGSSTTVSKDHPPVIEVISDSKDHAMDSNKEEMPLLVYVAREKRPSHHHHFKAGALNVLLKVSGLISNSPYILVLDCDMYCNDPSSARQAMCFHLDSKLSPKLAFVQFPQTFANISQTDIYDGQWRYLWQKWHGMDGIGGPILSGTGFYIKRKALYGIHNVQEGFKSIFSCVFVSFPLVTTQTRARGLIYRAFNTDMGERAKVLDDEIGNMFLVCNIGSNNGEICVYILNVASFFIGLVKILQERKGNEMFVQAFIPFFESDKSAPSFDNPVMTLNISSFGLPGHSSVGKGGELRGSLPQGGEFESWEEQPSVVKSLREDGAAWCCTSRDLLPHIAERPVMSGPGLNLG
ncbi:hypothetical protein RD792_017460 [Penstemon davidsonii]|uniref:Uncharacterized protein n=1 Tax=Penstemon davidsonii TaxID=160366 RepID=A0ABR0CPF0_9LAMI|nr:hypothetical protein RD792_017460 [Penstemon davidsonii]